MSKRVWIVSALALVLVWTGVSAVQAGELRRSRFLQESPEAPVVPPPPETSMPRVDADAGTEAPQIPGLGELPPEDLAAMMEAVDGELPPPVRVVAEFLQLEPDQVRMLVELLQRRHEAAAPVIREILALERRLREQLSNGAPADEVGETVIAIHQRHVELVFIQRRFLEAFTSMLDDEQLRRYEAVRLAARLQPLLPAFKKLSLL